MTERAQIIISTVLFRGIKIVFILLAAFILNYFFRIFLERFLKGRKIKIGHKKIETLIVVFGGTLRFIIWSVVLLMILPEFGVNIAPILTSLGLVGLAVGMAAREIIADFISGLFILLDDQFSVGDKIQISGLEGRVREITLRKTVIEDKEGNFHFIPNSQIKIVTKKSDS